MPGGGQALMAHTTACPACGTTFRVTAEQLLARQGDVRCGRCGKVFNAHETLTLNYPPPSPEPEALAAPELPEPAVEWEEPVSVAELSPAAPSDGADEFVASPPEMAVEPAPLFDEPVMPVPPAVEETVAAEFELPGVLPESAVDDQPPVADEMHMEEFLPPADEPPVAREEATILLAPSAQIVETTVLPEAVPEAAAEPVEPLPDSGEPDPELDRLAAQLHAEAISALTAAPEAQPIPGELTGAAQDMPVPPVALVEPQPPQPVPVRPKAVPRWLMPIGSLLLLVALLVQGALFFRTELVAYRPASRPPLEQMCSWFGCRVALPQNPDLLSIETSSLEAEAGRPGVVVLSATLRNRATYAQGYPLFELTLTDYQDKLTARRIFQPQEYLAKDSILQNGMPANEEIDVKLHLDLGELKAAGYRVYLFYSALTS